MCKIVKNFSISIMNYISNNFFHKFKSRIGRNKESKSVFIVKVTMLLSPRKVWNWQKEFQILQHTPRKKLFSNLSVE